MPHFRTFEISDPRFEAEGLRQLTVKSALLRMRADLTLWLPAAAPEAAAELPLVILLHGVYGSHWAWSQSGGVHRTAQRLIETGELPPLALAMPSDGLWGDGSGYLPHPGRDFERWIIEEVPAAVRRANGIQIAEEDPAQAESRRLFLCGLSMGGFGALRLGAKYGARCAGISAHSSITEFEQLSQFVEEPLSAYGAPAEDGSVLQTILRHCATLPPLRFDCGLRDSLLGANRQLHRALDEHGIAHRYEEFPGGHEWPYWEEHVAKSLLFFGEQLRSRPL